MRLNLENNMKSQRGFTLIEIMIVVVIVGILAKVAMPAYTSYIARGKVIEAQSTLSSARVAMEQYFQDHRTYVGGGADINAVAPGACPLDTPYFTYYCLSPNVAASPTASTYTIMAANLANVGLGAAGNYTYTIDQSNNKSTTKFNGTSCTASPFWLSKMTGVTC
jgi:type IV pilus assembly protein PilE